MERHFRHKTRVLFWGWSHHEQMTFDSKLEGIAASQAQMVASLA